MGQKGTDFQITITGNNTSWVNSPYNYVDVLFSGSGVQADDEIIYSSNTVKAIVNIDAYAPATSRNVTLNYYEYSSLQHSISLNNGFTVNESQEISISPSSARQGDFVTATITGVNTNWQNSPYHLKIEFSGSGINASNETVWDSATVFTDIHINGATIPGVRDVTLHYSSDNLGTNSHTISLHNGFTVLPFILDIGDKNFQEIPQEYIIFPAYPNPFNPATTIRFGLPQSAQVQIVVYNCIGEKVGELINEYKPSGYHTVNFDASNLSSGIYFYVFKAGSFTKTSKMLLIR